LGLHATDHRAERAQFWSSDDPVAVDSSSAAVVPYVGNCGSDPHRGSI
jgi:hypothetical protein